MNKKLQKGLTTTMAAAMGVGIVVPTVAAIAAPATTTTGWVKAGTTWNYLKNGAKATGWVKDGSTWYFLNASGTMQTGWVKDGSTWYFLNASGAMKTGWVKDGASWYFLNASGAMQTGWVKDAGTWYYLFNSGSMAVNTTVDGWKLDGSGAGSAVVAPVVPPVTTAVTVSSVSAVSATSFSVAFSSAPADITKVAFTVLQGTTPVTVTAAWNASNTVATLTSSSNLPAATYSVDVKNDATDLGTSSVTTSQQKIAKISITSNKLGVVGTGANQLAYATYTVLDQYGNDITNSSLGNGITFQTGVGNATGRNGLITVQPTTSLNLLSFTSGVVMTGQDTNTGVATSATLTVTSQVGTLNSLQVGTALTNVDNKVLTDEDTTDVFYLPYTATDISGNPTSNWTLVKNGLILGNGDGAGDELTTSNSYVTAKLIQDPNDSTKAVIQVTANLHDNPVAMDMPVVITAMTWTGQTSSLNVTLKKAAALDTFTLNAPAADVAVNENAVIPFTAYDQNGVQLTKWSDLQNVQLTNAYLHENADGTAEVLAGPNTGAGYPVDGTQVITAMTPTGKYSSVTINVEKAVLADSLALDNSVFVPTMEASTGTNKSTQIVDFGVNFGGFTAKDQYGRNLDITADSSLYAILATATGNVSVTTTDVDENAFSTVGASSAYAYGGQGIQIIAGTAGTGTVTFKLVSKADYAANGLNATAIDTKSQTFSVVNPKDITGYTMDTVANPIYVANTTTAGAINAASGSVTGRVDSYSANPCVYGTTTNGAKVMLAGNPIIGAYVDNTTDFAIDNEGPIGGYSSVYVTAGSLAPNVTASSTNLTVTVKNDYDGSIHSVITPIKSSTAAPIASNLKTSIYTFVPGINVNNNLITVNLNTPGVACAPGNSDTMNAAARFAAGRSFTRFDTAGNNHRTAAYFRATDQYGTIAMPLAQVTVVSDVVNGVAVNNFKLDSNGTILSDESALVNGETVTISAVTTNGLVQTMQIQFIK